MAKAKTSVKLDTKPAEKKLRELGVKGEQTSRRVGGKAGALGGFKQGAIAGAGFRAGSAIFGGALAAGRSSLAPLFGEATSGFQADLDAKLGAPQARARQAAREETIQATAHAVGVTGDTSIATRYYNSILEAKHLPQQIGANKIQSALGSGRGGDAEGEGPMDRLLKGITGSLDQGFKDIMQVLGG